MVNSKGVSFRVVFVCLVVFLAAVALAITPATTWGQSATTGIVSGVVTDPSNAVVVGAKVTLAQQGTNLTQNTVTDSVGRYVFPAVRPGSYTLTVSASGFKTSTIPQVDVEIMKGYTENVTLAVGQASQTVEVTSAPGAELQTSDATIGAEIGRASCWERV